MHTFLVRLRCPTGSFVFSLEMGGGVVMEGKIIGEGQEQLLPGPHVTLSSWLLICWVPLLLLKAAILFLKSLLPWPGKFERINEKSFENGNLGTCPLLLESLRGKMPQRRGLRRSYEIGREHDGP